MRAFLVFGCESAGGRFIADCFVRAGCFGDSGHDQRLDLSFAGAGPLIVWRRSFPHFREWPNTGVMLGTLRAHHYAPIVLHLHRRHDCAAKSQVASGHVTSEAEALANIARADALITDFASRNRLPIQHVSYESLVTDPACLPALLGGLGLAMPAGVDVRDGNAKWLTIPAASSLAVASEPGATLC